MVCPLNGTTCGRWAVDSTWTVLVGAAVGSVGSLAGVAVTAWLSGRLESRRQQDVHRRAALDRLHAQAADVLRLMFRAEYSVYSVCWFARYLPDQLDAARVALYEQTMERVLPELQGALAVLAGLDKKVYDALDNWTEQINVLDGRVRVRLYRDRTPETVAEFATFVDELRALYRAAQAGRSVLRSQAATAAKGAVPSWRTLPGP